MTDAGQGVLPGLTGGSRGSLIGTVGVFYGLATLFLKRERFRQADSARGWWKKCICVFQEQARVGRLASGELKRAARVPILPLKAGTQPSYEEVAGEDRAGQTSVSAFAAMVLVPVAITARAKGGRGSDRVRRDKTWSSHC